MQSNFFENLSIEAMEISMRMTPQDAVFGSEPLLWIPRGSKPPPPPPSSPMMFYSMPFHSGGMNFFWNIPIRLTSKIILLSLLFIFFP